MQDEKDRLHKRCIPIKKALVDYMLLHFPEFVFQGTSGDFYGFTKTNEDGIYDHIIIQRDFYEGVISLVITEVASCYNKSWKGIPNFTIGYETDIAVLMTGKKVYDVETGWHRCNNDKKELEALFSHIKSDIENYVTMFFSRSHEQINDDQVMKTTYMYMVKQLPLLNMELVQELKQYFIENNRVYSKYFNACRKNNQEAVLKDYELLSSHPQIDIWISAIGEMIHEPKLSGSMYKAVRRYVITLFYDYFNFYNLR